MDNNNSYNEIIKDYFANNFLGFHLLTETSHGPFWGVKFANNNEVELNICGDIGFSIEIFIDNTKYELWQYDRTVNNALKTNNENILYQLNVLKRFLSEVVK